MNQKIEERMSEMMEGYGRRIVRELGEKYGFDIEEGMGHVKISGIRMKVQEVKREEKRGVVLPFCGKIENGKCHGIRLNHGLYTQCTNDATIMEREYGLCKTCNGQAEKNSDGRPTYGYIKERLDMGKDYRDKKGKAPTNYGNIMEKLNITRREAEREAANQGVEIPEEQFQVIKGTRGRPKKSTIANDTSGSEDDQSTETKRGRGRPKKEKTVKEANGEDLIKNLVEESQRNEKKEINEKPEEEEDEDEEELAVIEIIIKGKKYLKAGDNTVYDRETHEEIGMYDEENDRIIEVK
tara:strand:+ start:41 stop:928 length:888 start_codon:yes stop_codon:yes gene_type:complete